MFCAINHFIYKIQYMVGSVVILLMRLYWGYLFFQAGYGKLGGIDNVVTFFESLGIMYPLYNAWAVAGLETVGGLALMVGLFSRLMALPLVVIMCTAYATAHYDGMMAIFTDPTLFMAEQPFMYLLTASLVFAFGPGMFSADTFFWGRRKCCRKKEDDDNDE